MAIEIYTAWTLSQIQTILALTLSVLGFGWFVFLSNAIKLRALNILEDAEVPILETIIPVTITEIIKVVNILRIKWIRTMVVTSAMVVFGLVLTSFEGIIVFNIINYVELCDTAIVKTQAQIMNEMHRLAYGSSAEVEAMMNKRNKSGVPSGILVGQIPEDVRWKFDTHLDVNPYTWKSSCSLYKTGVTQVNMNTSVLYAGLGIHELLPEVHADFIFRNSPNGYNYTRSDYVRYVYYNTTNGIYHANGALLLLIEEFTRGDFYTIGMNYMNRLWTMRVPETTKIPFNPDINYESEIISVPIVVKAYTCEMERVKEGVHGSYNVRNLDIKTFTMTVGRLVSRYWSLAVMSGKDSSIYEFTPEHWASYLAVKDTQTARVEQVHARINRPCIVVQPAYALLVCVYILMFIIGMYWVKICCKKYRIPSSVIEWASFACKESGAGNDLFGYNLGITSDNILKIKLVKNLDIENSRVGDSTEHGMFNLFNYKFGVTSDNTLKIKLIETLDGKESSNNNTTHDLFGYSLGVASDNILMIELAKNSNVNESTANDNYNVLKIELVKNLGVKE